MAPQASKSSTSRSPSYRFLHEQRHQFGAGAWHLLHTVDLIALSTDISTKGEKIPGTVFPTIFPDSSPNCCARILNAH